MKTTKFKIVLIVVCAIIGTSVFSQDIFQAVTEGNTELIKKQLQKNPDLLNAKNPDAMTPLNLAAEKDQYEAAVLLLKNGADPLLGDNENSGPIHLAAISGSIRIIDLLMENGVDIDVQDDNGLTALHFALSRRQFQAARHLINEGTDIKIQSNNGFSTMQFAAIGGDLEIVKLLGEKKAEINTQLDNGTTPLFSALSYGHTAIVKYLVENGADINAENDNGDQPLSYARNSNCYEAAEYLIANGADVKHKNQFNQTPLHSATQRGSVNIAELFLEKGADINAPSKDGRTPLAFAAYARNSEEISKFLVLNGADVNPDPCKNEKSCTCGPNYSTPLHTAVRHGHVGMTKVLVDNGAKINVYDNEGLAPIHRAVQSGNMEIVGYLIDHGAFINCKEKNTGSTELHLAVAMGYNDIADLLVENGSCPRMQDNKSKTPFDYAWTYNRKEIAYDLLAAGADDSYLENYITQANMLEEPVNYGEASIWFLGHSGWAVKTQNHFLIFDYFCNTWDRKPGDSCLASGYILPEQIPNMPVTVFATHAHGDHYDQRIFDWKNNISDIEYVLCWNQNTNGNEYTMIPIHEEQTVRDMNVYVNYSTDLGGGYVIEVDGLVLFHMGDHANGEDKLMTAFTDEIDMVAERNGDIDIVFGGIRGCSLGQPEQVKQGIYYTIEKLHPKLFVPMHTGAHSFANLEFAETAKKDGYNQKMLPVFHRGDHFTYVSDKAKSELTGL